MNHSIKKALLVLLISAGLAGQVQGSTVSAVQVENARATQVWKILRSARALSEFVGASVQKHITVKNCFVAALAVGGYFVLKHWSGPTFFRKGEGSLEDSLRVSSSATQQPVAIPGVASTAKEAPLGVKKVCFEAMLTGEIIPVECRDYASLEQLKVYLAEQLKCSSEVVHILFAGRKVETSDAFRDCNQENYHVIVKKNRGSEPVVQRAHLFEHRSVQENLQLTADKLNTLKKLAYKCEEIEVELLFGENQNATYIVESSKDLLDEIIDQNFSSTYEQLHNALAHRFHQLKAIKNEAVQVDNELDND